MNPFVKTPIVFECKRYGEKSPVSVGVVRELQGILHRPGSKYEKAAVITTSRFTGDAIKEAREDACLELIDGDQLVDLFVKHKLGVKEALSYEIDAGFFAEFDADEGLSDSNSAKKKTAKAAKKSAHAGKRAARKKKTAKAAKKSARAARKGRR